MKSEKLKAILPEMKNGLDAVLLLLKVTTWITAGIVANGFLDGKLSGFPKILTLIIIVYMAGFAVDGVLGVILPYAYSPIPNSDKKERTFRRILKVFAILLLAFTGTLSWWAMPAVADMSIEKIDDSKELDVIAALSADASASEKEKTTRINEAKRTEAARVMEAKRNGHSSVLSELKKGSDNWQRNYLNGNKWFRKAARGRKIQSYVSSVDGARRDSAEMVQRELSLVPTLLASGNETDQRGIAINSIAGAIQADKEGRTKTVTNVSSILFSLDMSWMILAFLLAWMIGMVDGHKVKKRKSFAGLLFHVGSEYSEWLLTSTEDALLRPTRHVGIVDKTTADSADNLTTSDDDKTKESVGDNDDKTSDDKLQPLSDKGFTPVDDKTTTNDKTSDDKTTEESFELVDKTTIVVGKTEFVDTRKFVDVAAKWYKRQFPKTKNHPSGSATESAQKANKEKWEKAKDALKRLGKTWKEYPHEKRVEIN